MLFNTIAYLIFLPCVVLLHFVVPHRYRWLVLLVASYAFYMSWNTRYLALILAITLVNYWAGLALPRLASTGERRLVMIGSLVTSLGILFVFKYWNFFNENAVVLAETLGLRWRMGSAELLLPVGISFYTFQTLSYTIDVYRKRVPSERHLGRFALYVSFFPQLVAGPIERASRLLPQIDRVKNLDLERVAHGLQLVLWGLFKKVVVADRLAVYVDAVYGNVGEHTGASYLLATYAFAFQIYCDFSGYSDIAVGSARVLGFDLMENFRTPYFSRTMREFWQRWHISLSTWLRDYLYIPLGGNRKGDVRTYQNLLVTMLLGGLWHGASWNFVIWGALHGGLVGLSRGTVTTRDRVASLLRAPKALRSAFQIFLTFHLACLGWIFFRADTLTDSATILRALVSPWGQPFIDTVTLAYGAVAVAVLVGAEILAQRRGGVDAVLARLPASLRYAYGYILLFAILLAGVDGGSQFIYFQF